MPASGLLNTFGKISIVSQIDNAINSVSTAPEVLLFSKTVLSPLSSGFQPLTSYPHPHPTPRTDPPHSFTRRPHPTISQGKLMSAGRNYLILLLPDLKICILPCSFLFLFSLVQLREKHLSRDFVLWIVFLNYY